MTKRVFEDITNVNSKRIRLTIHKSTHRTKLLRWIYEVCSDFRYSLYTYTLAVIIVDKYTEKTGFEIDEYQLIGITALFIAAKIEESKTLPVSEYSSITAYSCAVTDILNKEKAILSVLDYDIFPKLPQSFISLGYHELNEIEMTIEDKSELLNCFIAAQLEMSSYTQNVKFLYLKSKQHMEKVFERKKTLDERLVFYIEHYSKTKHLIEKINVN